MSQISPAISAPPAETVPVPAAAAAPPASPLSAFTGDILPTRVSLLYHGGLALVALGMVLLPVCYVALIGLTALALWFHLIHDLWIMGSGGGLMSLLFYITPLIAGVTLICFMLKPLFAKRPPPPPTFPLDRQKEPLLFAFIEHVCKLVRAPVPKRVVVNCDVNASAGFRLGLCSLASNDLVLTIGLPLASGLNMREFAGVLAHEFGHFAQGAGMRLSYVIRQINFWFARVVYDPDQWDQKLERAARGKDIRIAAVIHCARGAVWITRRILWALMNAGHAISCFMLRQMEYDADSYECKVAGSDAFADTMSRIRTLSVAAQTAFGDMRESWRSGRLPDNLPDFINRKAAALPAELQQQLQKAATTTKTKIFHTHPADADRVEAARAANAPGVFRLTAPAADLFADFPALSKALTRFYYEKQHHLPVGEQNLVASEESLNESAANADVQRALQAYLNGVNTVFCPIVLTPEQLVPLPDWTASLRNLRSARDAVAVAQPRVEKALKEYTNADNLWIKAASAQQLLQCGFGIPIQQFGLSAPTLEAAQANRNLCNTELERTGAELKTFSRLTTERLAAAFQLLAAPPVTARIEHADVLREEGARLASVFVGLGQAFDPIHALRRRLLGFDLLLRNRQNHKQPGKVDRQLQNLAGESKALLQQVQHKTQGLPYPFPHARGQLSVADYARAGGKYATEVQAVYTESQSHLDRIFSLYYRILGRLVVIAEKVEANLPELPPNQEVA